MKSKSKYVTNVMKVSNTTHLLMWVNVYAYILKFLWPVDVQIWIFVSK